MLGGRQQRSLNRHVSQTIATTTDISARLALASRGMHSSTFPGVIRAVRSFRTGHFFGFRRNATSISTANILTRSPDQTGDQITRSPNRRVTHSGQFAARVWVNHDPSKGCASARPRQDSVICPASANAFPDLGSGILATREHAAPSLPLIGGCVARASAQRGGAESFPLPQPTSQSETL